MKKNLSKNTVKSMAIGLAIAMGSSVAISGVSGNLIKVSAQNANFQHIKNPDFTTPMANNQYIVTTENYLFKVKDFDGGQKTAKAIFVGKANLASITSSQNANGTNVPYAASLANGVLTVVGAGNTTTYTVTIDQIGDGVALKTYTISSSATPTSATLTTLTKDEVNAVLAKATTVKTKAFDGVDITGTTENAKIIFPETLTTLEDKAIGGIATANASTPQYFDLTAIHSFNNFQATSFDKDTATNNRTVNIELANHTDKKAFDTKITGKANVTSIEKQAPTITSAEYDGQTKVTLTASEDLKESQDLATFSISKKDGSKEAINVTNAKVISGALTKIELTLSSKINEEGTYLVKYVEATSKEVKDANENKLAKIDSGLEFTVDRTAPTVKSVEVSNDAATKVVVTFDKEIKQKAGGNNELKAMFTVKKTNQAAPETYTINSAQILDNTKVELTLNKTVVYGDTLTVTYKKDSTNDLQSKIGTDVENFENKEVTNNVNLVLQENDTIDAGGYTFKVLSDNQTVALTGKKTTGTVARTAHNNGTVKDGVVSIGGKSVNVTQIGDGTNALTGDNFNVAELNNIIPNVTKIEAKAFDGKTLEGATRISFPKVTEVKANGLGIKAGCETVELPAVGNAEVSKVVAEAFKATDGQNSVTKVKVKEDAKATLQSKLDKITVSKVVTAPEVSQTIDMGKFQFTISTKDNDETDTTVGTAKLTKVTSQNSTGSNSGLQSVTLQDGVLTGQKEGETFKYNLTEIAISEGKEHLTAENFANLENNLVKVTKIANNTFTGATLPAEVTFPAVAELGENSFKGVKGLTTLTLPALKAVQVNNISNQAFGSNSDTTSVTLVKVNEETAYALKSYFVNNSVKVKPIEVASATANNVVISGKKGDSLSHDIVIKIENEYFATDLNDVTHWFTNLPAGLTAKVKEGKGGKQVTVTISGTPTALSSGKVSITIPSKNLTFGTDILVNTNAKFDITEKPSTGGGSSSGSYSQSGSVSLGNKDKTVTSENTSEGTTAENKNKTTTDTNIEFKDLKIDEINLPTITGSAANFSDVPATHWASESIGKLSSAGIIKGVPGGGFNANGNSKRADVAIMLTRLLGLENKTSTARFSDVDPNAYYANAVGVARQYGIINGNADGTFNPESYISRQDTMVMISRILDNLNVSTNADTTVLAQFSDTANISSYALEATSKLVNLGIINGNEGKINPKHAITRAEMAVIMDRVYGIIDKKVKEEAAKETTTESTSTTETTTSKDGSTTTTESTSTTETTTSKQ